MCSLWPSPRTLLSPCGGLRSTVVLLGLLIGLMGLMGAAVSPLQAQIPQQVIATNEAAGASDVDYADIDGDGDQDIVSASSENNKIAWYENRIGESKGDGFGPQQPITTSAKKTGSVATADLDGDGDPDVIVGSRGDGKIGWHENQIGEGGDEGNGFGPQQTITTDVKGGLSVATADLDGDGDQDVLSTSHADDTVAWYENRIGGSEADSDGFGPQQVLSASTREVASVATADLDGDGDQDVLSASRGNPSVAWYENEIGESGADSDGFGAKQIVGSPSFSVGSIAAADLNGDGAQDVIIGSNSRGKVAWYANQIGENETSDDFGAEQTITIGGSIVDQSVAVTAADIDGDGDQDVLSAFLRNESKIDEISWYENKIGESGTGGNDFGSPQEIISNAQFMQSAAAADLDGDGDPDVLSASGGEDKVSWYENRDGESGADDDGFGPRQPITVSVSGARAVAVADLDGDGDRDVLSASDLDNKIAWYENRTGERGADGFGRQQIITSNAKEVRAIATEDLDQDGDDDLLTAFSDTVAWYENQITENGTDGDGFGPPQVLSASARSAQSVTTADLDGDGDQDVLSASWGPNTVSWYENQIGEHPKSSGFGPQKTIMADESGAESVVTEDLDGDGDQDVISASGFDKVAWHENEIGDAGSDSDGFGPQQIVTTDVRGIESIAVADLNGDDNPDVLSASFMDDKIAWYENEIRDVGSDDDGFGSQQTITTNAKRAGSVATADLDKDGDQDVLAAFENTVTWYGNQIGEPGTDGDDFEDGTLVTTEVKGVESVAAADLDEDGDSDLLSASRDDNKIAWYENSNDVLPVELAAFEARRNGATVHLVWQTVSETNNASFHVQRRSASASASSWTTVGQVEGSGTTSQSQSYQFTDADQPYAADSLTYRLQQIDTDGSVQSLGTITVRRTTAPLQLLGTSPNPARNRVTVRYALPAGASGTLQLYDVMGRQVRTVAANESAGRHEEMLDVSGLAGGIYFLRLSAGDKTQTQKMTVVK